MATSVDQMAEILKGLTDDPETLAEFYEASGDTAQGRAERRKKFETLFAEDQHRNALKYAKEHSLLTAAEEVEFARRWCEAVMEEEPWEALEVARNYNLIELALQAAVRRSEQILSCKQDASPAIDIARRERADDAEYCKRAARHAFAQAIRLRNFREAWQLTREFWIRGAFTAEEHELAWSLARAEEERERQKWGRRVA